MNKVFRTYLLLLALFVWVHSQAQNLNLFVKGKDSLETKIISTLQYNTNFTSFKKLKLTLDSLSVRLQKKGYIYLIQKKLTKKNDSLYHAYFELGQQIKTIRIFLPKDFNPTILNKTLLKKTENYFDVPIDILENTLMDLNKKMINLGDPFSSLQLINLKKENTSLLTAKLKVTQNKKRQIDSIVVKGYEKFPKSFIKHHLKLKAGKPFNLETIKKRIETLNDIAFARKIKEPEVLFSKDSTTLYLYIEKVKTNNFDGFLGFGTNEVSNKLEFDGYLDLRLNNNLNFGERLRLLYKSDEIDQQTFSVNATLPYLFKTPVGLDIGLRIFRKDSTFTNATQSLTVNYQINRQHSIGVGISATNSTDLQNANSIILNDYRSTFFSLNYNFSKPQFYDSLFPIQALMTITYSFGKRDDTIQSQSQQMLEFEGFNIFNLNLKNSIYTRINGAMLTSNRFLDNELFRFGGINSIRGFEENSIVAQLYGVLNTEYRYRLSNTIYVHSVFDAAYFENQITNTKEKLFAFGFGLGLLTNSGLFRLNYSSGKTENRAFRLADSKVHISLTATF